MMKHRLLDQMYRKSNVLVFAEGLGNRLEHRGSLKALGFKVKCYCWVMGSMRV